ncbi:hypothetical protein HanPI659440_Chr11g0411381 [Helianthus annuus]|nr:hypothetical protein HanPI659440_Chr11g0411381 [Helianthus annuus]
MILYPRFLCLIFRHLLPNLSFEGTLPAYAQAPMPIRIFTDCARVNESKRTDARPVTTPLCGAIPQGNYNPEIDPYWLDIKSGVDQIFVGDAQEPVVVQPQVDLQQPPVNPPEPEPIQEPVIAESVVAATIRETVSVQAPVSTSSATGVAVETDEVILELDAALDAGPSSRTVDKGKRPMEEDFVDDMLTEKEYLLLVMKDLQNRISSSEREKRELFRPKVASFGPSSDWSIRLASLNDRANDLDSIVFSSSSSDDDEDRRRPDTDTVCVPVPLKTYKRRRVTVSDLQSSSPIVASVTVTSSSAPSDSRGLLNMELSVALPSRSSSLPFTSFVEATSMATSLQPVTPMMSSPIPAVPLFGSLSSQMGTGNVFALSGSSSLQAQETRQARPKVAFGPSPPMRSKKGSLRPPVLPSSGPRPSSAQPSGSRPPAPRSSTVSASRPSSSGQGQNFQEFVRGKFQDAAKVMVQHKNQISRQQKEIAFLKKRDAVRDQQMAQLFRLTKDQSVQLGKFITQDASTSARQQTLVSTTDQLLGIVTDLVSLLAAQGEISALNFQVQAKCKMDELKKIRDDLDKDKDPNAAKQGEQSRRACAPETATSAHVEGESSGAAAGGDKGPVESDTGALSDSELDHAADLVLGSGEVVEEMVEDWRTDDDLAGKFNFIETAKGKRIEYDSLPVNSDVIRGFVFGCEMPEEIFNPIRIPEEVSLAAHKWFRNLPDETQRKRYLSTKGEYSGQIRSWDFDSSTVW